jgi:hypothetical protein
MVTGFLFLYILHFREQGGNTPLKKGNSLTRRAKSINPALSRNHFPLSFTAIEYSNINIKLYSYFTKNSDFIIPTLIFSF